jgi:hypothetical protein
MVVYKTLFTSVHPECKRGWTSTRSKRKISEELFTSAWFSDIASFSSKSVRGKNAVGQYGSRWACSGTGELLAKQT